jgi:uncharacterized Tic20 family protein
MQLPNYLDSVWEVVAAILIAFLVGLPSAYLIESRFRLVRIFAVILSIPAVTLGCILLVYTIYIVLFGGVDAYNPDCPPQAQRYC